MGVIICHNNRKCLPDGVCERLQQNEDRLEKRAAEHEALGLGGQIDVSRGVAL